MTDDCLSVFPSDVPLEHQPADRIDNFADILLVVVVQRLQLWSIEWMDKASRKLSPDPGLPANHCAVGTSR
jgi:hypothetical protein